MPAALLVWSRSWLTCNVFYRTRTHSICDMFRVLQRVVCLRSTRVPCQGCFFCRQWETPAMPIGVREQRGRVLVQELRNTLNLKNVSEIGRPNDKENVGSCRGREKKRQDCLPESPTMERKVVSCLRSMPRGIRRREFFHV